MNNIISAWSPSDLVLPKVQEDTQYGMWFVTEEGSIDGLDISFKEGDWLVYLKKDGVGSWFKTSGGISVFNGTSSANNPDPGIYTRFRLDNAGNIIGADYLEEKDLPKHKHAFTDIDQKALVPFIQDIVGGMFQNRTFSSIKTTYDEETKTISSEVNYDGLTLSQNEFGQMTVIGGGGGGIGGATIEDLSCGSHTHDASQIENLKEFVINVMNSNSSLNVKDIPIDGTTIILNSNGQLSAVAAGIQKHQHKMDDITDLNKNIANVWASNQPLQGDFSDGRWNFTSQTIGYSINIMNKEFKEVNKRLDKLENALSETEVPEPEHLDLTELEVVYPKETKVLDKDTLQEVIADTTAIVSTKDFFYPANYGELKVYIDDQLAQSVKFDNTTMLCKQGNFRMTEMRDSWFGTPMYMGKYQSMKVSYDCNGLKEGYHTIFFVHSFEDKSYKTKTARFVTYQNTKPKLEVSNLQYPKNNFWVSGISRYKYTEGDCISFTPILSEAYISRFIPSEALTYTVNNGPEISVKPKRIDGGNIYFANQEIKVSKDNTSKMEIKCTAYSIQGDKVENKFYTPELYWDETTVEKYRVRLENGYADQTPSVIAARQLLPYESNKPIPKYELVIKNNIAVVDKSDNSAQGGADYSIYPSTDYYWINLKIPSTYVGNVSLAVRKEDGSLFKLNKNGTLQDIKLFVAQSDTDVPSVWVNGNIPYCGYGAAEGLDFAGLDLFKSTQYKRQITFGQRPNIKEGFLFVRIGVKSSIDLKGLVDSIEESIDEWSK